MSSQQSKRLVSLDILRGITIAGMLMVNNPGTWSHIYAPLDHAEWIGLTPTDLVFPFFMFCMGVAMYFSLRKFDFKFSPKLALKIVRRTVLLFLIGWAIHWFSHLMYGLAKGQPWAVAVNNLPTLRILGVFQRLALCYFFGSLCAIFIKHKMLPWVVGGILVIYAVILGVGHGYDFSLDNIVARIDNAVMGPDHMYHESAGGYSIALDPEGILSTLPCIAHTLIGFLVGKMIIEHRDNRYRMARLLEVGFAFILLGWLLHYGIPCSKKVWSSTYVLITTGLAMSVLALLILVIDVKGHKKWCHFFQAFGINPLSLYVLGSVFSIIFGAVTLHKSADFENPDPVKASTLYTQAAQQGIAQAQNNLAVAYYTGTGVDVNKPRAVQLLQQAAGTDTLPKAAAHYNLALAYMTDNTAANDAQAVQLLTLAADSAMQQAQFNLGLCYDFGKGGLAVDHKKAAELYSLAAQQGLKRAQTAVEACYSDTLGVTAHNTFNDLFITDMTACDTIAGKQLTAAQRTYNSAVALAQGAGERTTVHSAVFDFCKAVTADETMASCLFAIIFILFNWIFGYILYKKNIIIKI